MANRNNHKAKTTLLTVRILQVLENPPTAGNTIVIDNVLKTRMTARGICEAINDEGRIRVTPQVVAHHLHHYLIDDVRVLIMDSGVPEEAPLFEVHGVREKDYVIAPTDARRGINHAMEYLLSRWKANPKKGKDYYARVLGGPLDE